MAYTGSALPFLLSAFDRYGDATVALDKPVILTGSQVPLFDQETPNSPFVLRYNTDACQNVCAAVAAAHSGAPEVGLAFGGRFSAAPASSNPTPVKTVLYLRQTVPHGRASVSTLNLTRRRSFPAPPPKAWRSVTLS